MKIPNAIIYEIEIYSLQISHSLVSPLNLACHFFDLQDACHFFDLQDACHFFDLQDACNFFDLQYMLTRSLILASNSQTFSGCSIARTFKYSWGKIIKLLRKTAVFLLPGNEIHDA